MKKREGLIGWLAMLDKGSLWLYVVICTGCGAAMIYNMAVQGVSLAVLSTGNAEEQKLVVLTLAVVTVCAVGVGALCLAMKEKKESEKNARAASAGKRTRK